MSIFLIIIGIIVAIVVVILAVAYVMPKKMHLSQSVVINKNNFVVFEFLKHFPNHAKFNVWALIDPNMTSSYSGIDGEVGNLYHWVSNNKQVGEGKQQLVAITPGHFLDYKLTFIKPYASEAKANFVLNDQDGHSTEVIWTFEGEMSYPFNLLLGSISKTLSAQLQEGLNNLKTQLDH